MLALMSTAWVVPGLVGPALAGVMADFLGWRWVFLALAPLSFVAAGLAFVPLRSLRLSPVEGEIESEADWAGDDLVGNRSEASARWKRFFRDPRLLSIGLALGAGLFLFGLGGEFGVWAVLLSVLGLAMGLPALQGLLPPGTLRARPGLPAAVAVMGVLGFTFFGAETFIPLALTDIHGLPASVAGLPLSLGTIFWTTGAWIQAREASRRSRRAMIGLGLFGVGVGIAGTTLILLPALSYWLSGVAWSVAALGMGIAYSTTSLVILELAPAGEEGKASASLQLATNLGIAMGAGAGGGRCGLDGQRRWLPGLRHRDRGRDHVGRGRGRSRSLARYSLAGSELKTVRIKSLIRVGRPDARRRRWQRVVPISGCIRSGDCSSSSAHHC